MPATEQTWYNQKLLHVIFGCTGLLLLISTLWMFLQDHNREWKGAQRDMRRIDEQLLNYRLRAAKVAQEEIVKQREKELLTAQSELPPKELIDQFKAASAPVANFSFTKRQRELLASDGNVPANSNLEDNFSFASVDDAYEDLAARSNGNKTLVDKVNAANTLAAQAREAITNATDEAARSTASQAFDAAQEKLATAEAELASAQRDAVSLRSRIVKRFNTIVGKAKFQMDDAVGKRKLLAAKFGKATADQGLLVRDGKEDEAVEFQSEVDAVKNEFDVGTTLQEETTARRNRLRTLLASITAQEDASAKNLDDAQAEVTRLNTALDENDLSYFSLKRLFGKNLLTLPVVDAFGSPLKIVNDWSDKLTEPNGSFGEVRRFDRCVTCHQGIDKTAPGSATDPAYEKRHEVVLQLQTPDSTPAGGTLEDVFGIKLAQQGLIQQDEVTVEFVTPNSLAARAFNTSDSACAGGLREGDVIRFIGEDRVDNPAEVSRFLLVDTNRKGALIEVVVERGLPEPFTSHPRLDLYVGSLSPHKRTTMACTVCHEGQGSGTSFQDASHTPDSIAQENEWRREHGWFNNHHWIYPMMPARFAESTCLKCHHEVVDLGASERFPETPAPKLLAGHNLIQAYGCFGCHEINGHKSATERVGPDLRLEPNYFAAAAQLAHDPSFQQLPEADQALAHHLVQHPEDDGTRHRLLAVLSADQRSEEPQLSPAARKVGEVLTDIEIPGILRKVGPSLRHVAKKNGPTFLYDWIRDPKHFRPNTKMPQIFGMWKHLENDAESLEKSQQYEPVEILGLVTYLLDRSQPMNYIEPAEGCEPADVERGKLAFEARGCLACHEHGGFDDETQGTLTSQERLGVSRQLQGPNLTNLGDKFNVGDAPDGGAKWLYTWLRNPQTYHPRTNMPNMFLEPTTDETGTRVDPAADIAAFLLSSSQDWKPSDDIQQQQLLKPSSETVPTAWTGGYELTALEALSLEYLRKAFFTEEALKFLKDGIPADRAATLKGSEIELLNVDGSPGDMETKLLNYIGSKTVTKYGCYGCHDVPGFEGAKPIGVALADWGRKDPSKIAFEHIAEYIAHGHGHGGHGDHAEEGALDESFYTHRLEHHDRTGFIYQKLKEPRSYDFEKAHNKEYNERLRMPMFPFNAQQREEVITFILGLVAEPPADKFIYHPNDRQQALIDGKKVLDKYNCAGCHILEPERWEIEFQPGAIDEPFATANLFPFMAADVSVSQVKDSATPDQQRGTLSATLTGMPQIQDADSTPRREIFDKVEEEWLPLEPGEVYDPATTKDYLTLWEPTAVEGNTMEVASNVGVEATSIKKRHLAYGGDLTLRLLPRILEIEKVSNSAAKGTEVWGWLPPPLHNEGTKVQPDWLHSFLLDPYPIRPAAYMRMPKFNMSPAEATAIVNYFAARDNAAYPYEYVPESSSTRLAELEGIHGGSRFDDAMNIVTYTTSASCVSCHVVADYDPGGPLRGKAPNLANVYERLRPDYVRRWVANPKQILPYTPMLSVILYDEAAENLGGLPQELYGGSSVQQLDGVVDLLMNFDKYTADRSKIAPMVKPAPAPVATGAPNTNDQAARANNDGGVSNSQ